MLFNSFEFLIFLPVVFLLYWLVFGWNVRVQNAFILAASYFFYGCWDWRFLFLLFFVTLISYSAGLFIDTTDNRQQTTMSAARRHFGVLRSFYA